MRGHLDTAVDDVGERFDVEGRQRALGGEHMRGAARIPARRRARHEVVRLRVEGVVRELDLMEQRQHVEADGTYVKHGGKMGGWWWKVASRVAHARRRPRPRRGQYRG